MSEVTLTLTEEQVSNLPDCSQFGDKFRTALKYATGWRAYELTDTEASVKLFKSILKFYKYYDITFVSKGVKIHYPSFGIKVNISGTTVKVYTPHIDPKTTIERAVKTHCKLVCASASISCTMSRKIATDYLKVLANKECISGYDQQVLKILTDELV